MQITEKLLTINPYSRPLIKLTKVNGIVIHYVGNPGSSAIGNRNYFESLKDTKTTYASSHYIVGLDGEIIRCVPENEIAYCSNGRNNDTISIENCHPDANGKFNAKTTASLIGLCSDLCARYNLNPLKDIIRHYDVTGKMCPLWYVNNPADWEKLKSDIAIFGKADNTQRSDAEKAIDVICQKCGFSSPQYWKERLKDVVYFDAFVCGVVKNLK